MNRLEEHDDKRLADEVEAVLRALSIAATSADDACVQRAVDRLGRRGPRIQAPSLQPAGGIWVLPPRPGAAEPVIDEAL